MSNQSVSLYQKKRYLETAQPSWLVSYELCPKESLDINEIYSSEEYWDVNIEDCDPGMPILHRHWLINLIETTDHLRDLNLERCNLGDLGLEELGEVLKTNTSIRQLNLSNNNITAHKALKFLEILEEYNFTLNRLSMNEGNKDLLEKNKNQHLSFGIDTISLIVQATESDKDIFNYVKRRIEAFNKFNTKIVKVHQLLSISNKTYNFYSAWMKTLANLI